MPVQRGLPSGFYVGYMGFKGEWIDKLAVVRSFVRSFVRLGCLTYYACTYVCGDVVRKWVDCRWDGDLEVLDVKTMGLYLGDLPVGGHEGWAT